MRKPKICIVGPGVVGKSTGRAFIAKGIEVGFVGRTEEQVQKLRDEGFTAHLRTDFSDTNSKYDYDVTMLTVPTPTINGKINLDAMELAAIDLGKRLKNTKDYHVVVVKSTVPPGTTEDLVAKIVEEYSGKTLGKDFGLCMNPEYLREESAYEDTVNAWIIVVGEYDRKSGEVLAAAYENFDAPYYRCKIKEAEMQKYVHNLYNAAKITFFNEMREIAKAIDVDTQKIFKYTTLSCEGMWNPKYGTRDKGAFSGACLPKDTKAFYNWATKRGLNADFLGSVISVNETFKQPTTVTPVSQLNGNSNGKTNGKSLHTPSHEPANVDINVEYTL